MPRNIFPFKISDDEPRTPLSVSPYNSRVVEHMLDSFDDAKNYKYVAFRPGYPLQAAELNEIQEYFYLEFSIIAFITNAWNAYSGTPAAQFEETDLQSYAGRLVERQTPILTRVIYRHMPDLSGMERHPSFLMIKLVTTLFLQKEQSVAPPFQHKSLKYLNSSMLPIKETPYE